ncbi:hypothetical protein BT67DRAFT_438960 [Trichocladium antarcticum]|uniref:Protein kinase domain-containing protein n=1 Tax=Trichocladium antarcticum TaxID=1450529 RepID=A0AAN6US66_9PEZI|nr:hypothetical protein BT67DRAFT_438960 [Trichocladium antarcticum]
MFSLPGPGRVDTGENGHAYIFDSASGESYIFLNPLAGGVQSTVQLVANIFTNEVVVRKVSKFKPLLKNGRGATDVPECREFRILDHLDALVHNPVNIVGATPRLATCISHENTTAMSRGPRPAMHCVRASYWKLCNGGSMMDWACASGLETPASIVARCIAQVSETLHFMYNSGGEAVYHCDLHLGNVFVHFGDGADGLPDFYIGDFGWARTASEALADSRVASPPGDIGDPDSPPPGTARPGQRRCWDMMRFIEGLKAMADMAVPLGGPQSDESRGLGRLFEMAQWLDEQEQLLAARNPLSRPHSLVELIREARKLERTAMASEKTTEQFNKFLARSRERALQATNKKPYVFKSDPALPPDVRRARAENYGHMNVEGPWSLLESV